MKYNVVTERKIIMAGKYSENNENRRRRPARRRRRWQYYIPTVVMMVLAIVCVVTVSLAVAAVLRSQQPKPDPDNSTKSTTTIQNSDNTNPSDKATEPSVDSNAAEVAALIEKADFIAAGYDYEKAISMLESSEHFDAFPELAQKVAEYKAADSKLVTYASPDTITHIFFHSLIVDTDRAFDGDEDQNGYNMYMTTVDEFKAILQEMYERGYVLISPYDMAYEVTDASGTHFTYGKIRIPAGKKPFLMSQDDLNYYSYMIGTGDGKNETPIFVDSKNDGFAHKIVVGEDGYPTCEYMDADGNIHYGDYDLVPILETFIQEHPDFSYHGARAILGMTGYEGVFGYRTKPGYNVNEGGTMSMEAWNKEVEAAKEVAQCLRDHGWILASHSYGHPAYGNISADRVAKDSDKWENTVQPIIGDTDVILYPHGSDIHTWRNYTFDNEKFAELYADGYRYFFNVDGNQYWNQLGKNYFRGGRRNLDGFRMYHNPDKLSDLFDVADVWDDARPTPVPSNGSGM